MQNTKLHGQLRWGCFTLFLLNSVWNTSSWEFRFCKSNAGHPAVGSFQVHAFIFEARCAYAASLLGGHRSWLGWDTTTMKSGTRSVLCISLTEQAERTQGDRNPALLPPAPKWVPLQLLSLALLLEYPLLHESRMLPGSVNQVTQEPRFGHRLWQNKLKHSSGYLSFQHQVQLLSQFIIRGKWGRIWKQLICESKGV